MGREQESGDSAQVEVRLPAHRRYVSALRSLASSLGAQCDLTVDEIEDLQIAIDEACALLLPHALEPGGWLSARFTLAPGCLEVVASVPAAPQAAPDRTGFSWTVLSALADRLEVTSAEGVLAIALTKQRETSDQ
jgi:serine/threonine-protein kinase RsbW